MKNKRFLALLLALIMAAGIFASCKPADNGENKENTENKENKESGENKENTENKENAENKESGEQAASDIPTGGEPDKEQKINTFSGAQPNTFDPSKGSDMYGNDVLLNVVEPLVRIHDVEGTMGKELEYLPAGAEKWDVSEDGKTYTFHIRKGNKWNDGKDVTAQDYAYGIQRSALPETGCPYANLVYYIKNGAKVNQAQKDADAKVEELGVKTPDDYTLVIELEEPTPYFLDIATQRVFFPQRKDLAEQYKDTYSTAPENTPQCGPFVMTEMVINSYINFKKNDNYWDKDNVKLQEINMKIIQDTNTIYNALKTGEIDFAVVNDPKWKSQFLNDPNFYTFVVKRADTSYLMTNAAKGKLTANAKVRQAIAISMKRQELIDSTANGVGIPAFDFVPPAVKVSGKDFNKEGEGWVKTLQEENPDPKKLFIEGIKEEGLGEDPSKVTLKFLGSGTDQQARLSSEFVQQNLEEALGCKVDVDNQDWNQFINIVKQGNYEVAWLAWSADFNDPSNFLETCYSKTAAYPTGWVNENFDKLILEAQKEQDVEKRIQILHDAEKILVHDEAAIIPLVHRVSNVFRRKYIRGASFSVFSSMGMKNLYTSGR